MFEIGLALMKKWSVGLLGVVLLLVGGCGQGPELVEVVGRVTYRGGACPGPGALMFAPIEGTGGGGLRPASAEFAEDGAFAVQSFQPGDGVKPGRYRVTIVCWQERPQGYNRPGVNVVPPQFRPADLVVNSGERRMEVTYDIP